MEALTVVGAVFAGIGALFVAAGLLLARANRRFDRGAARAAGEVVGVRWHAGAAGGDVEQSGFPVLRFTLPDGRTVETVARTATSLDLLQHGRPVTVLYDPADPRRARLDSRAGPALLTAALTAGGGAFMLLGLALAVAGIALRDALPGT